MSIDMFRLIRAVHAPYIRRRGRWKASFSCCQVPVLNGFISFANFPYCWR